MPQKAVLRCELRDRRDVWNARLLRYCQFSVQNEMPMLPTCDYIPKQLVFFTKAKIERADGSFIHFYGDDYKFERIWRTPERYLPLMMSYGGAIAPDFSLYREMPLPQQKYNVYRSRTIGYWWSRNGIKVIPNVRWSGEQTYDFCFDGLPKNSVVAVGTHGCVKHLDDRKCFIDGFMVMLDRIKPSTVIVYGSASDKIFPPLFVCGVNIVQFESDYSISHKKGEVV
jgi:hypothetical protein